MILGKPNSRYRLCTSALYSPMKNNNNKTNLFKSFVSIFIQVCKKGCLILYPTTK